MGVKKTGTRDLGLGTWTKRRVAPSSGVKRSEAELVGALCHCQASTHNLRSAPVEGATHHLRCYKVPGTRHLVLGVILVLVGLVGCAPGQPFVTPQRLDRGLVLVLPGIEGASWINEGICWGLADAGVGWAIELVDWTMPGAYLHNLRDQERNRKKAEEIADKIERYQMSSPNRPVILVGHSGGGAMAVWVAEALSPGSSVDGIIVLSASLSPGYLLDISLGNSRRGIVSFHSRKDWVFLGAGTATWGTMDGQHTASAGMVGFDVPAQPGHEGVYRKLFQIAWREQMARTGHAGGHRTSGARQFVKHYVAPLVLAEKWDKAVMEALLSEEKAATKPSEKRSMINEK